MSTHDLVLYAGTVFAGFFAIMSPLANTPVFLALPAEDDDATRREVARRGLLVAFVIGVQMFVDGAGAAVTSLMG